MRAQSCGAVAIIFVNTDEELFTLGHGNEEGYLDISIPVVSALRWFCFVSMRVRACACVPWVRGRVWSRECECPANVSRTAQAGVGAATGEILFSGSESTASLVYAWHDESGDEESDDEFDYSDDDEDEDEEEDEDGDGHEADAEAEAKGQDSQARPIFSSPCQNSAIVHERVLVNATRQAVV